ncbi:LPS export ABC transporter periplasmic protein LptC [Pelagibacterales bacterium SAG-MED39]|nr:LPS export ABC transporter periplasmic protein LptC [Pelagibacterales bacterium SAG-MED39]
MNKKLYIQFILFFLIILILFIFYFKYLKNNNESILPKLEEDNKQVQNLIEDLKYFSRDIKGNEYTIEAKSGDNDENNSDIIHLKDVTAKIKFDQKEEIIVTSDKAIYNNNLFDTEFFGNVIVVYDNQKLLCEKMKTVFSKNVAFISGNIIYKSQFSNLYADLIEIDLEKRTSKISMYDLNKKVKITHKKNGIN